MAAPQRNYPYNPHLAKALAFNRNNPQFNSVMSLYGSDSGHEGDESPQAFQPGAGRNQVQQVPQVPNVAELVQGVPAGQNTHPVEPALIPANTSAVADQALAVGGPGSAAPSLATTASGATEEEVVAQAIARHGTALDQIDRAGSQPEADPSGGASFLGHTSLPVHIPNGSDTAHKKTSGTSSSSKTTACSSTKARRGRKGAATPNHAPRRSIRESALKTAQLLHELLVPKPRRARRSTAAANSGGTSAPITTTPLTPPPVKSAASTSKHEDNNESSKIEKESKAGLSSKALGKRRRIEPETDDEEKGVDQLAPSDVEESTPAKKARRVRNLQNRSTPARFLLPKEEPPSPSPSLATPKRKRAPNDDGERRAGPSKRGRAANDEEEPAPLQGPIRLGSAPRRAWSVEAQPSVVGVGVPPVVGTTGPLPVPPAQVHPTFIVVLPELGPQPQQQPQPPLPPPPPPHPLRRTFAKIFIRGG